VAVLSLLQEDKPEGEGGLVSKVASQPGRLQYDQAVSQSASLTEAESSESTQWVLSEASRPGRRRAPQPRT
jgi:hypothetical protein